MFLSILLLLTPVLCYNTQNVLQGLFVSNYVTLVLNNIYITMIYKRNCAIDKISYLLVTRMKRRRYIKEAIKLSILSLLVYSSVLLIVEFSFFGLPDKSYSIAFWILVLENSMVYATIEVILIMSIFSRYKFAYLSCSVLINFMFHYMIVLPSINKILWKEKYYVINKESKQKI